MYDRFFAIEVLRQIHRACQIVLERFDPVKTVSDFTDTPGGMEKLDAICMQLIAIGERPRCSDRLQGVKPQAAVTWIFS